MKIGSMFVDCDNMYTTGYCTMYTWTQVTYINTKLCLLCPAYTAGLARHYKRAAVGVSKVYDQGYLELAGDGEPVHHPTFKYAMPSLPRCLLFICVVADNGPLELHLATSELWFGQEQERIFVVPFDWLQLNTPDKFLRLFICSETGSKTLLQLIVIIVLSVRLAQKINILCVRLSYVVVIGARLLQTHTVLL